MPKPENLIGKGFDSKPENINRSGRPRKLISTVNVELEKSGIKEAKKQDIVGCYLRLIQLSFDELKDKSNDENQPALIRIVSKSILSGKGIEVIETMLDRTIGKPKQAVDHTSNGETIFITFPKDPSKPDDTGNEH